MTRVIDTSQISTADSAVYYANEEPVERVEPEVVTLRIHVTPERMESMNVGLWAKAEDTRKTSDTLQVLKHFVVGSTGHYMDEDEALKLLKASDMGTLNKALAELMKLAQEAAVPNE